MSSSPAKASNYLSSADPAVARVVIVGGAGNVGKGIFQACCARSAWTVTSVDPAFEGALSVPNFDEGFRRINSMIEDIDDNTLQSWFAVEEKQKYTHVEFIVTNDSGNREHYAVDPNLGLRNDARFNTLVKRIVAARDHSNKLQSERGINTKVSVHISYIGGSWTRRQSSHSNLVINDTSPAKLGGGSNPYEIAKSNAQTNARQISRQYAIAVTFYDYISIVPNFAPNFSVNRMTRSGLENGVIKFSQGDYGRPLLHALEAGEYVADLVEKKVHSRSQRDANDDDILFETVLVPGHFVTFQTFANIAKEAIESHRYVDSSIVFEAYKQTPDELRTRCISSRDFVSDPSLLIVIEETRMGVHRL
jgi:nucleoside-diphosphate-sugar epimerase